MGLEIDSMNQTITIPLTKLKEIEEKIKAVLNKSKVTLKELQSLIGSLNFACRAFYTDAAASIRMGIYVNGEWTQARWGDHFQP